MSRDRVRPFLQIRALLEVWLIRDFYGASRRSGSKGSATLTTTIFAQGFLSYLFASISYNEASHLSYLAGTLSFVGALALLSLLGSLQDNLIDPADRDLVRPTPLSTRTWYTARALHLLSYLSIFAIGLSIAPAVLAYWNLGTWLALPVYFVGALLLVGTLAGLLQLPLLLASRLFGESAASSLSALLRATLLGGSFFGLALGLRAMLRGPESFPGGMDFLQLLPSYWFAHAQLYVLGQGGEARWALLALAAPVVLAISLLAIAKLPPKPSGRRHPSQGRDGLILRIARPFVGGPREKGATAFVIALMARERSFRLKALPLLGLPLGMIFFSDRGAEGIFFALMHNLPLAFAPFLIHGLPYADNWRAAWILDSSPGWNLALGRRAATLAFASLALVTQVLLYVFDLSTRGPMTALPTTLTALGLSWLLLPRLAAGIQQTCFSIDPEEFSPPSELNSALGLGLGLCLISVFGEHFLAPQPWIYLGLSLLLCLVAAWLLKRGGQST
jgi:hypothetical protein